MTELTKTLLELSPSKDSYRDPSEVYESSWRKILFFAILVYLQLMCNFDSGVLASVVGTGVLKISPSWEGWVASSVYLGHIAGCLVTGPVLNSSKTRSNIKYVILFCMGVNALCAWAFAFGSTVVSVMLLTRFMSGVSSAFIVVYCPLWVDDYAPANRSTIWMSVLQAGVPLGIVVGYMVTGLVRSFTTLTWQWAFYLQALMLIPGACVSIFMPRTIVNLRSHANTTDSDELTLIPSSASYQAAQLKLLFRNPLWLSSVFCLCSLYFVVTGLQLWSTAYLTAPEPIHAPMATVVLSFGITCITAPVIGVLIGGVLMDVSGGYSGNMMGATAIAFLCGLVASVSATLSLHVKNLWGFIGFIWIVLCTGGAVVPIMTGLSIACVPKEMRNIACSVAAVLYNLLGYFLGPLVCGFASKAGSSVSHGPQLFVDGVPPESLPDVRLGMKIVLQSSFFALFGAFAACVIIRLPASSMFAVPQYDAKKNEAVTTDPSLNC